MAKVLIWSNTNKGGDIKTTVHTGDIIDIREDDFQFGAQECLPDFDVISCPGISVGRCKFLLGSWKGSDGEKPYRFSLWNWDKEKKVFTRKSDKLTKSVEQL